MTYNKYSFFIAILLIAIIFLINSGNALSIGSCVPNNCPEGYQQTDVSCNGDTCYVTCNFYDGCEGAYTTIYNDSEFLPDLNIPSSSGAAWKEFQIGNYTPTDTSKCYRFRQTIPNNFVSSSDIDFFTSTSNFDSGIALYWIDIEDRTKWYDNQNYYTTGEKSEFVASATAGAVWVDSCSDPGDNFDSADSFINANYLHCAPNQKACDEFNESCDIDCYNAQIDLVLVLATELKNNLFCNNFNDFSNTGTPNEFGQEIDFVNFDSQRINFSIDEYDAILNHTFNNTCNYWPQCNPADPCCDINGNIRSNGYVCRSAHDEICTSATTSGCGGTAHEDRCDGLSFLCPNNNYNITYNEACTGVACSAQSCSTDTFQPERTCLANVCQTNEAYTCPDNLNCQNSISCKTDAASSSDCRTGYNYSSQYDACWLEKSNGTAFGLIYDNNGNLISDSVLNYSYNNLNQLVNITTNSGTLIAQYFYDHNDNRIKTIVFNGNQNTTTYYFDNFVQIVNSSGVYNETYYYYYDKLVGKKDVSGALFYYHPNLLGSADLITNSGGNKIEDVEYEPFGELVNDSDERYTFTGYEQDQESGLLYAGARYYNPDIAQFIQPDNVVGDVYNPQDLNKYAYARNNPYRYTDPNGEFVEDIFFILWDIYDIKKEGFTTLNAVSLGVDILGLAVPFVGGGGRVIKGGAKATKIVDRANDVRKVASGVDKISDVVRSVDRGGSVSKINNVKNPGGRLGGSVHRETVGKVGSEIERQFESGSVISGGGGPERAIKIDGKNRFPDIHANINGRDVFINVGRTRASGEKVSREIPAITDLSKVGKTEFVPYDKPFDIQKFVGSLG